MPRREVIVKESTFRDQDQTTISLRTKMVESLTSLRQDWEQAAEGKSLIGVNGSIGLILFDLLARLELTPDEGRVFLGTKLYDELTEFMAKQHMAG